MRLITRVSGTQRTLFSLFFGHSLALPPKPPGVPTQSKPAPRFPSTAAPSDCRRAHLFKKQVCLIISRNLSVSLSLSPWINGAVDQWSSCHSPACCTPRSQTHERTHLLSRFVVLQASSWTAQKAYKAYKTYKPNTQHTAPHLVQRAPYHTALSVARCFSVARTHVQHVH